MICAPKAILSVQYLLLGLRVRAYNMRDGGDAAVAAAADVCSFQYCYVFERFGFIFFRCCCRCCFFWLIFCFIRFSFYLLYW